MARFLGAMKSVRQEESRGCEWMEKRSNTKPRVKEEVKENNDKKREKRTLAVM